MNFQVHRAVFGFYAAGLFLPAAISAPACTEARLYSDEGPAMQADRLTLRGRVCAQDTTAERLPLRIVLVVDHAAGPLFADYDPGGLRIQYLRDLVQSALVSEETQIAVVGFAGRSKTLAPPEGSFTRNPGELLSAIDQLAVPEPCSGRDDCRNYLDGLHTARALIEGDLAQTPPGVRVITQYLILFMVAGPHQPLASNVDCCEIEDSACPRQEPQPSSECQAQLEKREVAALMESAASDQALGVKLHILHLAADEAAVNDQLQNQMRELAFAGLGSYTRIGSPELLTVSAIRVLEERAELRVKTLVAANLNAKPAPDGPVVDSDADGLADGQEKEMGTEPDNPDTDGDGIGDLVETLTGLDPIEADTPAACRTLKKPGQDSDLDGLSDCDEAMLGTEPTLVDSDGDGMPDKLEVVGSTDFLHADAESDSDGDGSPNGDEISQHTDPRSDDGNARRNFSYRYEIEDEGVVEELYALPMSELTGVEVVAINPGTTPGVGVLRYSERDGALSWQDGKDDAPGTSVLVSQDGEFDLPSASYAAVQGENGKQLTVRVVAADLPAEDIIERVRIIYRKRQCVSYNVRNVRLMDTLGTSESESGLNHIVLFFAETPEEQSQQPGPFRMAEIPVVYKPPDRRDPAAPAIQILDEEFIRPM